MQASHKRELSRRFAAHLRHTRVTVLGIPDDYGFMDAELVERLQRVVPKHLP